VHESTEFERAMKEQLPVLSNRHTLPTLLNRRQQQLGTGSGGFY